MTDRAREMAEAWIGDSFSDRVKDAAATWMRSYAAEVLEEAAKDLREASTGWPAKSAETMRGDADWLRARAKVERDGKP